ncbi:MAG TPA: NAD-dependent epimerase/dehydratase family protein [Acidiferrobacter sp.]|nr:NAD-dependent epimerase/dehydratase family protein [Acidiferrobacter sp.]
MRVLVTGATGFIGQALVPALLASGAQVRGLGRSALPGMTWHYADLTQRDSLRGCCVDTDVVFHLAGIAHTRAIGARHEEVTVAGTQALLAEARSSHVRQFVFVSSIKADCSDDSYARSRRTAEDLVCGAGLASTAIIRPALVYSPGMKGNLDRLLAAAAHPLPLPIPRGGAVRGLIHRDDLIAVLVALLGSPKSSVTYTVTDGHPYTLREIYDVMRQGFGRPPSPYALPQSFFAGIARFGDYVSAFTGRRCAWDSQALAPLLEPCFSEDGQVWQDLALEPQYSLAQAIPTLVAAHRSARPGRSRATDHV